jgi:hypothetical protein
VNFWSHSELKDTKSVSRFCNGNPIGAPSFRSYCLILNNRAVRMGLPNHRGGVTGAEGLARPLNGRLHPLKTTRERPIQAKSKDSERNAICEDLSYLYHEYSNGRL